MAWWWWFQVNEGSVAAAVLPRRQTAEAEEDFIRHLHLIKKGGNRWVVVGG